MPDMKPVLIVLPDRFADWETPFISAIGGGFYGLSVRHATPGGGDVRSLAGLKVTGLDEAIPREGEIVVLCGGEGWTAEGAPDVTPMLRKARADGHVIAAICAGTGALARAGLLDDVDHTSNAPDFLGVVTPDYRGQARYQNVPRAVADDGIITSAGHTPGSFAVLVMTAAGVPTDRITEFRTMVAADEGL